jgi:hypothetical protein
VEDSQHFVEQIRGTADCLVLVECFGRLALHEKGFRAEQAQIIGVVAWEPRLKNLLALPGERPAALSVPQSAAAYFGVPLVSEAAANGLIARQRPSTAA